MKRSAFAGVCIVIMSLFMAVSGYAFQGLQGGPKQPISKKFTKEEIKKMSKTRAVIETKFGNIELEFYPKDAPNHVANFIELAKKGFYNGTTFHRVIPGFVIQGGDPNTKDPNTKMAGMGGPGYTIKAEFNDRDHSPGVLSMARGGDPDSAGSQFFICAGDVPQLDGNYTAFGKVTKGMDVVKKIVNQPRNAQDMPNERVEMKVTIVEPK